MDNLTQAQEWRKFAAMDLSSAEHLVSMYPVPVEIICYHCQQSAEKYLKSYLVLHGINPPRIHDLDELCKLCARFSDTFANIADHCSDLTAYGVQPRYPMAITLEERDMLQALSSAKAIRDFVLTLAPEMAPAESGRKQSRLQDVILECIKGDIVAQTDITAVVNAANAELLPGGGVAGAIHRAAGPGLAKECRPLAPISPGQAVITGGHALPNSHVIHCLGPVYGTDKPEDKLLANCYNNALQLAEQHKLDSIAFPAISTGIFGYPVAEAAEVAFKTILAALPRLRYVKKVRFVLHSDEALKIHSETLTRLLHH